MHCRTHLQQPPHPTWQLAHRRLTYVLVFVRVRRFYCSFIAFLQVSTEMRSDVKLIPLSVKQELQVSQRCHIKPSFLGVWRYGASIVKKHSSDQSRVGHISLLDQKPHFCLLKCLAIDWPKVITGVEKKAVLTNLETTCRFPSGATEQITAARKLLPISATSSILRTAEWILKLFFT
jgi:hypothetical protein